MSDNVITLANRGSAPRAKSDARPTTDDMATHVVELLAAEIGFPSADARILANLETSSQDTSDLANTHVTSSDDKKHFVSLFDNATRIALHRLGSINPRVAIDKDVIARHIRNMTYAANDLIASGAITHTQFSEQTMTALMGNLMSKTSSHYIGTNIFVEHEIGQ